MRSLGLITAIIASATVFMVPITWFYTSIYIGCTGEQGSVDERLKSFQSNQDSTCTCVDCVEDSMCGGLWKGTNYPKHSNIHNLDIHIIVSHCKDDIDWITKFTEGYNISSILVLSKCGVPVHTAPQNTKIIEQPNVGRCDHSYAKYITTFLDPIVDDSNKPSIVLFLKDSMATADPSMQRGHWNTFEGLIRAASYNGFSCGVIPSGYHFSGLKLSIYHQTKDLTAFSSVGYDHSVYMDDGAIFKSPYENLGSFYNHVSRSKPLPELVQVCYGGIFAASLSNIRKVDNSVWKSAEIALSRGDNIEEGHFMERIWGSLLANPLKTYQIEALRRHSRNFSVPVDYMSGVLQHLDNLVKCGDHYAHTCAECPGVYEWGEEWCSGDCSWSHEDETCQ